jgi:hypothetical protein
MKAGAGLLFLVGTLVILAGALAGGQVWAMSGSTVLGGGAGAATAVLLGLASRPLLRRLTGVGGRVLGEYRGVVDEDDFVETVEVVSDNSPRGVIERGVNQSPDRVAGSIRSLLGDEGTSGARGEQRGKSGGRN